jgi:hypothetical protein
MLRDKYHSPTVTATPADGVLTPDDRRRKLTVAIRDVLYLAAREAFDRSSNLHERCNLARLIYHADIVLRYLVNRPSQEVR